MPPSDEGGAEKIRRGRENYPSVSVADSSPDKRSHSNKIIVSIPQGEKI